MTRTRFRAAGIAALLGAVSLPTLAAAQSAPASSDDNVVTEIVVYSRTRGESALNIPQTVSVLDAQLLNQIDATQVGDALRFIPSASQDGTELGYFADDYVIRGFNSAQSLNGLAANRINHGRDTANVERIEVLKGPASVLYGEMQPGAVINVVTKRPTMDRLAAFSFSYDSEDSYRVTADLSTPFTETGNVRGRLNLAYEEGSSFVDFWSRTHYVIAPIIVADLSENTDLTIEGIYSFDEYEGFYNGVPASGLLLPNVNGRFDKSLSIGERNLGTTGRDSTNINIRVNHRFNDNLSLRSSLTWNMNNEDPNGTVFPLGFTEEVLDGDPPGTGRHLLRAFFGSDADEDEYVFQNDLSADFHTGSIAHNAVFGIEARRLDGDFKSGYKFLAPLDVFDPVYTNAPVPTINRNHSVQRLDTLAFYVQDRISLTDKLKLLGSVRYTTVDQEFSFTRFGGSPDITSREDTAWTNQVGVIYQPIETVSLFASRTESFMPTRGTTSGGTPFDPETGVQYEAGVKAEILDRRLLVNVAVFQITRDNLATADPANPGFQIQVGQQEAKGFEASVQGRLTPQWTVYASYAYTDTEVTRDNTGLEGNQFRNAPRHTASAYTEYRFEGGQLDGLTLGGAVTYVGDRPGDLENTFDLPSFVRLDINARYALTDKVELGLAVKNVTDAEIYTGSFSRDAIFPAAGRVYSANLKLRF